MKLESGKIKSCASGSSFLCEGVRVCGVRLCKEGGKIDEKRQGFALPKIVEILFYFTMRENYSLRYLNASKRADVRMLMQRPIKSPISGVESMKISIASHRESSTRKLFKTLYSFDNWLDTSKTFVRLFST